MFKVVTLALIMAMTACGDDEGKDCNTTVECSDEKEMVCDEPVTTEFNDGEVLTVRACTYITYEHCFESMICKGK
jgi:hypothetical protein